MFARFWNIQMYGITETQNLDQGSLRNYRFPLIYLFFYLSPRFGMANCQHASRPLLRLQLSTLDWKHTHTALLHSGTWNFLNSPSMGPFISFVYANISVFAGRPFSQLCLGRISCCSFLQAVIQSNIVFRMLSITHNISIMSLCWFIVPPSTFLSQVYFADVSNLASL